MKILLINKFHYRKGGAERAYFDMADMLQAAGHEVAFFAMEHPENESTPWSRYFVSNVEYRKEGYSWFQKIRLAGKMIWNREANKKLAALLQEFQPDIAHAHNIYHQLSPSIFHVLKKAGVPVVLTLHDYKIVSPNYNLYADGKIWDHSSGLRCLADRCVQESFPKSMVCVLEKWLHSALGSYKLIDALVAPSHFLANKVKELGWRGKDIQVIPNPLRESELTQLPLPEERIMKNRLVFFGRLSAEKGIDQLLHALVQLPEKQLILIGNGPARQELEKQAVTLGVDTRVRFLGARFGSELHNELQQAEAIVIPSTWYENLPYVVTESLAAGLVVVAAASGGISERIRNGENGFLYPLGDTQALVAVLQGLKQQDLASIRKNAHGSVSDLTPEVFREKMVALYQTLI